MLLILIKFNNREQRNLHVQSSCCWLFYFLRFCSRRRCGACMSSPVVLPLKTILDTQRFPLRKTTIWWKTRDEINIRRYPYREAHYSHIHSPLLLFDVLVAVATACSRLRDSRVRWSERANTKIKREETGETRGLLLLRLSYYLRVWSDQATIAVVGSAIGTLRSEDCDGSENVAEKVNSRSVNVHRDYSKSLTLSDGSEPS